MKILKRIKYNYFAQEIRNFKNKFLQDDYEILGFLGQGSTSRVFLGNNILNNQRVVIKIFKPIPEDKIFRQIRVNNKINNYCQNYGKKYAQNIPLIRLLDVVRNKGCGSYAFIFQYFPGSPMHLTPTTLIRQKRFKFMKQILHGLQIAHDVKLIHRDLKPSNILITNKGAKLFDFGLSKQIGVDQLKTNRFGTKCYYTPQVVFRMPFYKQKLDIWTCGLIFSQLLTMIKPILPYKSDLQTINQIINFCDYNQKQDKQVIRQDFLKYIGQKNSLKSFENYMITLRRSNQILPKLSDDEFELIIKTVKRMLKINPDLRPNASELLNIFNPIFQKCSQI